jgi:hypothetical protein
MGVMYFIGNFLNAIKTVFVNISNSIRESLYQVKLQRKTSNKFDTLVKVLSKGGRAVNYQGKITPNKEMAFIPALERPIFYPVIIDDEKGNLIIASEKEHDNLSHARVIEIDAALKLDQTMRWKISPKTAKMLFESINANPEINVLLTNEWKYDDVWITLEIKNTGSSLDFTAFDNRYSVSFGSQSNLVMNSEHMKFLLKASDMTVLTTLIIGFLCGSFAGYVMRGGA